jgi:hypothetical protein
MSGKTNIFVMFYRGSIKVMENRSWIYRDSPQGLRRMDYCNGVQGFINLQHLFRGILLMAVLGVHAGSVKI